MHQSEAGARDVSEAAPLFRGLEILSVAHASTWPTFFLSFLASCESLCEFVNSDSDCRPHMPIDWVMD